MKISKQSWHYKLVKYVFKTVADASVPTNLCNYFWAVIFSPVLLLMIGFVMLIIIGVSASAVFYPVMLMFVDLSALVEIITCIVWAFIMICLLQTDEVQDILPKSPDVFKTNQDSFTNVVKEWLKAKHDKICPFIDFI